MTVIQNNFFLQISTEAFKNVPGKVLYDIVTIEGRNQCVRRHSMDAIIIGKVI